MATVWDMIKERKKQYNTINNTYEMFPVGTRVQVITPGQDLDFFYDETGVVVSNSGKYLGIIVKFDEPRYFESGYVQEIFNFEPSDLIVLETNVSTEEDKCINRRRKEY